MPLLTVNDLSCERGGVALLDHLDFSVSQGELLQVLGPNGSGKTTLLRILAGLSSSYAGKLIWHNNDNTAPAEPVPFLYIGHKPGIKAMLTPLENLRWYAAASGSTASFAHKSDDDILSALAQWQLGGYEHQPCYQLSAGQQQRVALARLYLSDRLLWLLDEPFTAIDQSGVAQLETLLFAHAEAGGAAILTTHHPFRQNKRLRSLSLQQVSSR